MSKDYVIAYDLGTSGVKVALVDMDGRYLWDATSNYPLHTPHGGWAEQDPQDYWEGVCKVTREVLAKSSFDPGHALGLAFGTQWKGIIPLDAAGRVLHRSIIWLDSRAQDQADRLNEHFGRELFYASDYWPKLLWFRENHPDLYQAATVILEANSYLKWKATGQAQVDVTNHFVRSFDKELQDFYLEYLRFGDMSIEKFPPLGQPTDEVGRLTPQAAAETGLQRGTPVFGGCGDIPAITIGSGSTRPGSIHAYFGSSGWLGLTRAHSREDLYVSPFDEARDIYLYVTQAIGLSLNWTLAQLYRKEGEDLGAGLYDFVNEEISGLPPGSGGVLATPWIHGERPPHFSEAARACFLNLHALHDRRHMVKALMEGVCFTLKMNARERWLDETLRPSFVNAVGGGACSPVWMQALADILEVPVQVPYNPRHAGAVGTATCALIGLGRYSSYEDAAERMAIQHRYLPDEKAVEVYRSHFQVFQGLYPLLKPTFEALQQ